VAEVVEDGRKLLLPCFLRCMRNGLSKASGKVMEIEQYHAVVAGLFALACLLLCGCVAGGRERDDK